MTAWFLEKADRKSPIREKMTSILLLLHLTSFVSGDIPGKSAEKRTFHEAGEDDNVTFSWDSQSQTNVSLTNMICFLLSTPLKVLYELMDGVELPESQHQQFSGRVQCDGDALREGRVRLHLSRITAGDAGNYWCDLAAYDQKLRRWKLQVKLHFVLNVTQTSHSAKPISLGTTMAGSILVKGAEQPETEILIAAIVTVLAVVGVVIFMAVTLFRHRKQKDKRKEDEALVELQMKTNRNQLQHLDSTEQDPLKTSPDV